MLHVKLQPHVTKGSWSYANTWTVSPSDVGYSALIGVQGTPHTHTQGSKDCWKYTPQHDAQVRTAVKQE